MPSPLGRWVARPRSCRAGHTLVEVVIAAACLTALLGAVGLVAQRGSRVSEEGISSATVAAGARRSVDRVAVELGAVQGASLPLPPAAQRGTSVIEFRRVEGYAGGSLLLGNERRILRVASAGDPDDGTDNDSDGLVDEGDLVLIPDTSDPAAPELLLATGVAEMLAGEIAGNGVDDNANGLIDEPGLCFAWDTDARTVRVLITLERVGAQGQVHSRTAQTTVGIRN